MKTLSTLTLGTLLIAGLAVFVGCETESADAPVFIEPSAATVHQGGSVAFEAKGGYSHRWTLANNSLGYLSAATGPTTVYTASGGAGTNVSQTLTLTSTIDGVGEVGTASNQFTYTQTATAIIQHL